MTDETTLYEQLGGEAGIRQLVTEFYDEMERNPDAAAILPLHANLEDARQKLFEYFSGWLGGPPLYTSKYGHPRLRARHMHVPIGVEERDAWLICMVNALKTMNLEEPVLLALLERIVPLADHMRNQAQPNAEGNAP
ncbi:MAG: hypothetical protein CMQ24_05035 [Gammaproteobacteria bacterium]|nr:hypothetical protein [Gammaproteobacteria bacterium]